MNKSLGSRAASRTRLISLVIVSVVALLASVTTLTNDFVQDDLPVIRFSDRLHGFAAWREILTLPYWPPPALPDLYRPLTSLALAAEWLVGGGAPVVFHVTSCLLLVFAALAVFRFAERILPPPIALITAVLFAAHPIHAEAISLAVAQNEVLVTALIVSACALYLDARRKHAAGQSMPIGVWIRLGALYAAAALLKEQGLLLPFFLLLTEFAFHREPSLGKRIRAIGGGALALLIVGAIAFAIRSAVLQGALQPLMVADTLRGLNATSRALTMLGLVPELLRLILWPVHLRSDYGPQEFLAASSIGPAQVFGLLVLAALGTIAWAGRHKARLVTFGILWMFVALLPVSNVLVATGVLVAERTLILASTGFVFVVAGALQYAGTFSFFTRVVVRRFGWAVLALISGAGLARHALRERDFMNYRTFALAGVRDAPRNWRAQRAAAELAFDDGRPADGRSAYERAISLAPEPWVPRTRFAERLRRLGGDTVSVALLQESLDEQPRYLPAIMEYSAALISVGQYAQARNVALKALADGARLPLLLDMARLADSASAAHAPPGAVRPFQGIP